jgi:ABC-type branched-subunit amino acid transport system ATPase component/ABC-type branched-subunit amino acid transport system permease subunit
MHSLRRLRWVLLLLPLLVPLMTSNEYLVHSVLVKACIYAIVVAGLDLVVGYNGDVSVGHAGLFAVGAYTAAILMTKLGMSYWIALPIAVALAALVGVGLGVPALRLQGPYLAVTTIAFGLIIQTFVNESVWLTEGSQGIRTIPGLRLPFGLDFEGNHLFFLAYPAMVLALLTARNVVRSYWGRAFLALKANAIAAECSGVNRYRYKVSAFVLSAAFAGLGGALFVHIDKYVGPTTFSLQLSILFLIALIFGGIRSIAGNVIGALLVVVLPDVFNRFADYQLLVFGLLLLATLYLLPGGLASLGRLGAVAIARRRAAPPAPTTVTVRAAEQPSSPPSMTSPPITPQSFSPPPITPPPSNGAGPLLETENLTIAFGGLVAVNKLNLRIHRGEVRALIGPNGSGKSTTVNLLSGVYRSTSGHIRFDGRSLDRAKPNDVSRAGIARTFQNPALFGDMTILENVLVGLHHSFHVGLAGIVLHTPGVRHEEARAIARGRALLDLVGLAELADHRADSIAYGQQRRLEIARALAQDPRLILLDEPAAGLTAGEMDDLQHLVEIMRDAGIAVLLIEHHMDFVMAVSDRVTVLDFGEQIAEGTPAEVQRDERVIRAYLGTTEPLDATTQGGDRA